MDKTHRLKNGNRAGGGGFRPGGGRPADWLISKCRELVDKGKLIEFLYEVASGEHVDVHCPAMGEPKMVPASVKDRMRAVEMLLDRGYGKVPQPLEHAGDVQGRFVVLLDPSVKA